MATCSKIVLLLLLTVTYCSGTPVSPIQSNSPHQVLSFPGRSSVGSSARDISNLPPLLDLDLYDKEIGTWCAPDVPSSPNSQPEASEVSSTPQTTPSQTPDIARQTYQTDPSSFTNQQIATSANETAAILKWADAALRIVRGQLMCPDCPEGLSAVVRPVPSEMNLYVAMPVKGSGKLSAVLPDGPLTKTGPHDAWLVLDPTPLLAFGHSVHVFAIDLKLTDSTCISSGGVPIGGGECIMQVFKNRCPNLVVRRAARWRKRSSVNPRRCDIDFLPLIHVHGQAAHQSEQRLLCSNDVTGFAPCPALRSWNETSELICDPLSTNHKRCDSTHDVIKTRCRLFETCDQAVLLSGGWNWQLSGIRELRNVMSMYKMLRHNGFPKHSVKIFFANGVRPDSEDEPELDDSEVEKTQHSRHDHLPRTNPAMYPSALKLALRNHIRSLCTNPHCVDSFVIYLNSHTRSDGATLLWDADNNGEFDETELYTIRELLRDTQDCSARQVFILADQNNAGLIGDALLRSKRHSNVQLMSSTQSQQATHSGEFTHHWVNAHHGNTCVPQVFQESIDLVKRSTPRFEDMSNGTMNVNIFGAPCDVKPPFTRHELRTYYMGCQYVPTRIWLSRHPASTDPPPRLLSGR